MDNSCGKRPRPNQRMFGYFEVVFDAAYLILALAIGLFILQKATLPVQRMAGLMALVLGFGDMFHLLPRMAAVVTHKETELQKALGFGKLVTSITMTVFYLLLWHVGLLLFSPGLSSGWTALAYLLAFVRIALCLPRQNRWYDPAPSVRWAVYRNIPFLLLGLLVAGLFGVYGRATPTFWLVCPAVLLSFGFYLPVVLAAHKYRMLGMLMLPKTCMYLWILLLCVSI